jgi:hypothetical protein
MVLVTIAGFGGVTGRAGFTSPIVAFDDAWKMIYHITRSTYHFEQQRLIEQ